MGWSSVNFLFLVRCSRNVSCCKIGGKRETRNTSCKVFIAQEIIFKRLVYRNNEEIFVSIGFLLDHSSDFFQIRIQYSSLSLNIISQVVEKIWRKRIRAMDLYFYLWRDSENLLFFFYFVLIRANLLLASFILYRGKKSNWMRQRYWELFKSCFEAVESQTYEADAAALE